MKEIDTSKYVGIGDENGVAFTYCEPKDLEKLRKLGYNLPTCNELCPGGECISLMPRNLLAIALIKHNQRDVKKTIIALQVLDKGNEVDVFLKKYKNDISRVIEEIHKGYHY